MEKSVLQFNALPLIKFLGIVLVGLMLVTCLSACGKRGDPYRPSEITTTSS
jgi:predicted small lipoprotein YifL